MDRITLMNVEPPGLSCWGFLGPIKRWFFEKFLRRKGIYHREYLVGTADIYLPECVILRIPVVIKWSSTVHPTTPLHSLIGRELTLKPLGYFWGSTIYLGEVKEGS